MSIQTQKVSIKKKVVFKTSVNKCFIKNQKKRVFKPTKCIIKNNLVFKPKKVYYFFFKVSFQKKNS